MHDRLTARRKGQAILVQSAIGVVVLLLLAVTWMFTLAFTHSDEREAESRLHANLANLASSVQWQLEQSEGIADQALDKAVRVWAANPDGFDAAVWARSRPNLVKRGFQIGQIAPDGRVKSANVADWVGLDTRKVPALAGVVQQSANPSTALRLQAGATAGHVIMQRSLIRLDGGFGGTLVAVFDPWGGVHDVPNWDIGSDGLIALIRPDGMMKFLLSVTPDAELNETSVRDVLVAAQAADNGIWRGALLAHGPQLHVRFQRLRDIDHVLVIGVNEEQAMRPTLDRSSAVEIFAGVVTVLLGIGAALMMRQIGQAVQREDRLSADRTLIEQAYGELAMAKSNAEAKSAEIAATLAGMTDGVMMLDAELRLVNWNARFPERVGVDPTLLRVGMTMDVVLRSQIANGEFGAVDPELEIRRRMAIMRATRGTVVSERVRPDGTALELRRSRLPSGGLVTLYIDISARKRAEEALAAAVRMAEDAADQKSRFVAIVSHEIRTPLNAVINCLGLLDESDLAPSQRRLSETARGAGEALMELVNDILELSNAESGKLELRPTTFELTPLLEGVRAMFQGTATKRGVRLALDVAPTLPRQIRADAGRVRQVMMNLVSNAGKFSAPGVVTLKAGSRVVDGRVMLSLAVQDQGPPIPPDEAARLFVPFSRLRNARSSGAPGTGLGLAICERLSRLMGGQITLGLAPTGGNEFELTLPLEAADTKVAVQASSQAVSLLQRTRARLLIVEDIPANHLVAATLLRREGFRVDVAESGAAAIALIQRTPYDLVFMDLIMPEMDGLEATRRIRALQGQPTRLPIVALTATTSPDDRLRCLAAGMDDMLGKPIRPQSLFSAVQRYLGSVPRSVPPQEETARPVANDAYPILDDRRLAELAHGLPPATVLSLVDQCLADMRARLPALRTALDSRNPRDIEIAAHALSGMSASYGFAALENRMRNIIRAARSGEVEVARGAGEGMEGDLAVAAEAIRLHLRAAVA